MRQVGRPPGQRTRVQKKVIPTAGQLALAELHDLAAREWQAINRGWCTHWFKARIREYVNIHGYVSAGVSGMLLRCAAAHADADYLRALGYANKDHELVIKAQSFAQTAKGMELAAYEIACREGRAKRDSDALTESKGGRLAAALAEGSGSRPKSRATRVEGDPGSDATLADVASPFDPPPGGVKAGPGAHLSVSPVGRAAPMGHG
jgi:hypothetical protein